MLYIYSLEASQVNLIFSEPVPDDFIKKEKKKKAVQCTAHEISILIRTGHLLYLPNSVSHIKTLYVWILRDCYMGISTSNLENREKM